MFLAKVVAYRFLPVVDKQDAQALHGFQKIDGLLRCVPKGSRGSETVESLLKIIEDLSMQMQNRPNTLFITKYSIFTRERIHES